MWPTQFEGGAWGVLLALVSSGALVLLALALDRRLDRWMSTIRASESRVLGEVAARSALLRVFLWALTLVVILAVTARFSPPLAWLLLPAGALALALATANLLRDAIIGVGHALSRRVEAGEYVAIGNTEGVVVRVGIRTLTLRQLDGTQVEVPQHLIAQQGIRQLRAEAGGHPTTVDLLVPTDVPLKVAMEEARLAALLAPHAHLGGHPTVTLADDNPELLRIQGLCINPFAAAHYRAQVALAFRTAIEERQ